jgi:demethylmenaquinone methyltransferase/2-methoxy-6-polyprenyl-1,4-benzoquinol methylase
MIRTRYSYDRVAWCYEGVANVYSFGGIAAVKASQIAALEPGQRVLYVGVGAGEDALLAARHGVDLDCLDLSKAMLRRLARRLEREALDARLIEVDILEHTVTTPYDVVVANFVLNVFSEQTLVEVLRHIACLLAPGGRLLIADFRPAGSSRLRRLLYAAYYRPINWIAWAMRLCALHPIYDYARYFDAVGLQLVERTPRPLWSNLLGSSGPRFFESLTAERIP